MLNAIDRVLAPITLVAGVLVIVLLFAGPDLIGADKQVTAGAQPTSTATATPAAGGTAAPAADGKAVFASAGCGGCHTLADAGTSGTTGPNLDDAKPDAATVKSIVTSGSGIMPSFQGQLSDAEIEAVASYVSSAANH